MKSLVLISWTACIASQELDRDGAAMLQMKMTRAKPSLQKEHVAEDEGCAGKDIWYWNGTHQGESSSEFWTVMTSQSFAMNAQVVSYARTGGQTCSEWCQATHQLPCIRGMDDAHHQSNDLLGASGTRCSVWPGGHDRQSVEDAGCLQSWATQMCACDEIPQMLLTAAESWAVADPMICVSAGAVLLQQNNPYNQTATSSETVAENTGLSEPVDSNPGQYDTPGPSGVVADSNPGQYDTPGQSGVVDSNPGQYDTPGQSGVVDSNPGQYDTPGQSGVVDSNPGQYDTPGQSGVVVVDSNPGQYATPVVTSAPIYTALPTTTLPPTTEPTAENIDSAAGSQGSEGLVAPGFLEEEITDAYCFPDTPDGMAEHVRLEMVQKSISPYDPNNALRNGRHGPFRQINIRSGTATTFSFEASIPAHRLVESSFTFRMFDIDMGNSNGKAKESFILCGEHAEKAEIMHCGSDVICQNESTGADCDTVCPGAGACKVMTATKAGYGCDNVLVDPLLAPGMQGLLDGIGNVPFQNHCPKWLRNHRDAAVGSQTMAEVGDVSHPLQANRSVEIKFTDTSRFELAFATANGGGGRNFLYQLIAPKRQKCVVDASVASLIHVPLDAAAQAELERSCVPPENGPQEDDDEENEGAPLPY